MGSDAHLVLGLALMLFGMLLFFPHQFQMTIGLTFSARDDYVLTLKLLLVFIGFIFFTRGLGGLKDDRGPDAG